MRNLRKKMLRLHRSKRRMALAILLLWATPSMAGPPKTSSFFDHPTGAADKQSGTRQVQTNPFCDPEAVRIQDTVQLASGANQSTLRLKPVGKAIGLQTLSQTGNDPAVAPDPNVPKLTIETPPSMVRTNPLIGSVHHSDRDLVDAEIVDAVSDQPEVYVPGNSTVVLKPTVRARNVPSTEIANHLSLEPPAQSIGSPDPHPQSAADAPGIVQRDDQRPIHFSFTDQAVTENRSEQPGTIPSKGLSSESLPVPPTDLVIDSPEPIGEMASETTSIKLSKAPQSISQTPEAPRRQNVPAIIRNPVPQPPDESPKRYRPPVAVKSVPLEIERGTMVGAANSPVQAAPNFQPQGVALAKGIEGQLPTLHLCLAQVRSLTVGGTLQAARLADTSICKIVESGSNQLKLIGTSEGVTTLVVIAQSETPDQKPMRRAFEIHVTEAAHGRGESLVETCSLLNRSISETFPACDVVVLEQGDELMVAGRCDSQESAIKILRMVRKTCLVPVKDELIVH